MPRSVGGSTLWTGVRETCNKDLDIEFDGWQDGCGQIALSTDANGRITHTIGGFHLAAGRQIGKTHWGAGLFFGMCQTYPDLLCLWTAHHTTTSDETFESMQEFAARRSVKPYIDHVHTSSGNEEVAFVNGSRILFGARERGFGRGIPGVDAIFTDEAQITSQKAMRAMIATMNTSWLGLHIYAGTPPDDDEIKNGKAGMWLKARDEAWANPDPEVIVVRTEDMAWVEFGADDTAQIDDVWQWAKSNPSFPHRTPIHAFQRLRRKLDDEGFMREGLGLYKAKDPSIFDLTRWKEKLAIDDCDEPTRGALVLDVSPDREWSSIALASDFDDDRDLVMVLSMRGTAAAVAKLVELDLEKDVDIAITPGAAKAVQRNLNKAELEYDVLTSSEVASAYGTLQIAIRDGTVAHLNQPELNFALENTKSRYVSVGETESFDRRNNTIDISPAIAVACALDRWSNDGGMPYVG